MRFQSHLLWVSLFTGYFFVSTSTFAIIADFTDRELASFKDGSILESEYLTAALNWKDAGFTSATTSMRQRRDFFDALIKLKQLALVAKEQRLHQSQKFKQGLAERTKQALLNGRLNKDIETWKLIEAFLRQRGMVKASHLLVPFENDKSKALSTIKEIKLRIETGRLSFDNFTGAQFKSEITSSGSLGYFTVFEKIYPLESAAYETPISAVSRPIKTRFGYYLVQPHSHNYLVGNKRVSHILIKVSGQNAFRAKQRINDIHTRLTSVNFPKVASTESEDYRSSKSGGDLGFDRLITKMEAVKISLPIGQISKPFQSELGWHIMYATEITSFKPLAQARIELQQKIQLDRRVERELEAIQRTKKLLNSTSPVIRSYINNMLCLQLLTRSKATHLPKTSNRNLLIRYLMNHPLPKSLAHLLTSHKAVINEASYSVLSNEQ